VIVETVKVAEDGDGLIVLTSANQRGPACNSGDLSIVLLRSICWNGL
jgi:hypothetical protein